MPRRVTKKLLIRMVISLMTILVGYYLSQNPSLLDRGVDNLAKTQPGLYRVEEVSDGDTIIVNMNGSREIIRMIGIDTPETHHPERPIQCYGKEASEYARITLVDKKVRLEADPLNTNRDRYDRLLRYVYLPDGSLFNIKVISHGYGFSYTAFPFSKSVEFDTQESQAKQQKKGLWGACSVTIDGSGLEQTNPVQ